MPAVGQGAQVSEVFPALDWLTALTAHIPASLPLAWHFLSAVYTPVIWTPRRAEEWLKSTLVSPQVRLQQPLTDEGGGDILPPR